jgi:hypothetical protein
MFGFPGDEGIPDEQRARATLPLRYEDVTQDGRIQILSLPHATGAAVWAPLLAQHPVSKAAQRAGVLPILTRLIIEGGGGPISIRRPIDVEGAYRLAHTVDQDGRVNRLILTTRAVAYGTVGRTHGPPPPNAGERVRIGRVFGENVFTRPFAPPDRRRVLRFELAGMPDVPADRYGWRAPSELLELPAAAEPLDDAPTDDDTVMAFGLAHTDSNQHVNSLVYPRLFEEAALRRLAARGLGTVLLPRHAEIAYRKPAFAGDRVRVRLRAFVHAGAPGAVGAFHSTVDDKVHAYVRMLFTE